LLYNKNMGLLAFLNKTMAVGETDTRAIELAKEITSLEGTIRLDWTRRVYGDGVYSGYQTLRDFYKGKQWSFRKEGGGTMRTYNYCFTIVENMTAFLTNEPPQISSPPRNVTDPVERGLAEGRTKLLDAIHEDNALSLVFQRAVRTGSITGDAFIFGSIPTFKTNEDGVKIFDRIRYWNIEKPEHIQVLWKDENFSEMDGFIKKYRISVESAKRLFKEELKDKSFHVQADYDAEVVGGEVQKTEVPMLTIKELWTENEYLLMFNNDNKPVHYVKHEFGFVPLQYVPNIHLPGEPKGTSDIEHELDPQQEYNERASDLADIIKEIARPAYWGKNLDNLTEVRSGQIVIYQVGDDGDIQAMPKSGQTMAVESYLNDRKNDIIALSGLNQVLYPGSQVLQATGRALSVVMQGVNNKVSLRKEWWIRAFKELNKSILFHAEKHIPNASILIDGFYKTDVFVSSVLLRSVVDEISKFQAKVQSLTTTQHNVGISNPSEEQKLMKEELQDEILATEIAKQPGLLHQILADRVAQMNQATGGGMTGAGMGGINGQPAPITSDEDTAAGAPPAAGVASPVSPRAAIAGAAARAGGVAVKPK
jgi:SPP1 Gp6-like portal protein